jgi:hypothetical protein
MNITPEQLRKIALRINIEEQQPCLFQCDAERFATALFAEFQKLQATEQEPAGDWDFEPKTCPEAFLQQEIRARDTFLAEQEPVGYQQIFNAIAAATSVAASLGINISVKAFTESIGPLYAAPPDLTKRIAELEAETAALRSLANNAITTLKAERDELAAQNQAMREALETVIKYPCPSEHTFEVKQALTLPDLASSILRKRDAQVLDNAATRMAKTVALGCGVEDCVDALANWAAELETPK